MIGLRSRSEGVCVLKAIHAFGLELDVFVSDRANGKPQEQCVMRHNDSLWQFILSSSIGDF